MGISSFFRRSQAAGIVQALLDHQKKEGLLDFPTTAVANRAARLAWEWRPDLLEGKAGPKPHRVAAAAFAAATGAMYEKQEGNEAQRNGLLFALAAIFHDIGQNGHQYPFHHIDNGLLAMAHKVLEMADTEMREQDGELFKMMGI